MIIAISISCEDHFDLINIISHVQSDEIGVSLAIDVTELPVFSQSRKNLPVDKTFHLKEQVYRIIGKIDNLYKFTCGRNEYTFELKDKQKEAIEAYLSKGSKKDILE